MKQKMEMKTSTTPSAAGATRVIGFKMTNVDAMAAPKKKAAKKAAKKSPKKAAKKQLQEKQLRKQLKKLQEKQLQEKQLRKQLRKLLEKQLQEKQQLRKQLQEKQLRKQLQEKQLKNQLEKLPRRNNYLLGLTEKPLRAEAFFMHYCKMLEIGCLQIPQFSGTGVGR